MHKLILFSLLLHCLSNYEQHIPETGSDSQRIGLKGKVHTVKNNGYALSSSRKNPTPVLTPTSDSTVYDTTGNLIEHYMFHNLDTSHCIHTLSYTNGNLTSRKTMCNWNNTTETEVYDYESLNNLKSISTLDENGTLKLIWKYLYDSNNNITQSISQNTVYCFAYSKDGKLKKTSTYKRFPPSYNGIKTNEVFNKKNEPIKLQFDQDTLYTYHLSHYTITSYPSDTIVAQINFNKSGIETRRYYQYFTGNGALIKQEFYDANRRLEKKYVYTINKQGDILTEKGSSDYWVDEHLVTYEYIYDANGNWLEKISFEKNKPNWPTNRSITYYH